MKKDKYSNFMGDDGNYKIYPPLPNPDGLRGNPDTFDWAMNQGGDGLNGTRPYMNFDGDDEYSNHPGFLDIFKRKDTKMIDLPDGQGGTNQYSWGDIQADPNLMQLYDANQNLKKEKRSQWWGNFGKNMGNVLNQFSTAYQNTQSKPGGITDPNFNQPIQPITTNTPPPAQAGVGTTQIIGYVLIGVAVIGLLIYATKGDSGKTIVVQTPTKPTA